MLIASSLQLSLGRQKVVGEVVKMSRHIENPEKVLVISDHSVIAE